MDSPPTHLAKAGPCKMFFIQNDKVVEAVYEVKYEWRITQYGSSVTRHPRLLDPKPTGSRELSQHLASRRSDVASR